MKSNQRSQSKGEGWAVKKHHKLWTVLLSAALACALTGCMGGDAGEMFALPNPPEDYRNLNAKLSEVRTAIGGESIAPQSGTNTQTVQLQDLDADGVLESAVAFFRVPGAEKPLKIYIFKLQEDGSYQVDTVIEGVGSAIYSVSYEDVGGDPDKEAVVSWQISGDDHTLGVYSLDDVEGIEVLWVDSYTRFRLADLDGDGERELVVLTLPSGEETVARADYYDFDGAALALKSTAPLSAGIKEIKSLRSGNLVDDIPAIFVTSSFPETADQVVDILCCKNGSLTNITLDKATLRSEATVRTYTAVSGSDIDHDGVMEVPRPVLLPKPLGATDDFWLLEWRQFDEHGKPHQVLTTYHNVTDGWYFEVPDGWADRVTVTRRDSVSAGERAVVFSLWKGEEEAQTFLALYKLTGTSQQSRATLGNRQTIFSDATSTYAYELMPQTWDTGLTGEDITRRFHIIRTEWSTEN